MCDLCHSLSVHQATIKQYIHAAYYECVMTLRCWYHDPISHSVAIIVSFSESTFLCALESVRVCSNVLVRGVSGDWSEGYGVVGEDVGGDCYAFIAERRRDNFAEHFDMRHCRGQWPGPRQAAGKATPLRLPVHNPGLSFSLPPLHRRRCHTYFNAAPHRMSTHRAAHAHAPLASPAGSAFRGH